MSKDKKWIQKAVKHPGAFTEYCGGKVTEECIQRGLKSNDPTIRRRAALARTFRKMAKNRKKAEFGLEDIIEGFEEYAKTGEFNLKDIFANGNSNSDDMNTLGLITYLGALSTGALTGSLNNALSDNESYLRSTVDNLYMYATGGEVNNVPIEAEGGEIIETPEGINKVSGPSHNQGGVQIDVPEGSTVYSKRIKIDGKTMADRKLEREKREMKYRKLIDKTNDPIFRSTLTRVLEINKKQEDYDKKFQNIVRNMVNTFTQNAMQQDNNDIQREKFASGGDVKNPNNIDWNKILDTLIKVESSGNPDAVSSVGAKGYAQFMPETWEEVWNSNDPLIQQYIKEHGKPDIHTKDINAHKIAAQVYLNELKDIYKNKGYDDNTSSFLALTAYNVGPAKLDKEVQDKYGGDYIKAIADWKNNDLPFMSYSRKILSQAGFSDEDIFGSMGFNITGTTPKGNPEIALVSDNNITSNTNDDTQINNVDINTKDDVNPSDVFGTNPLNVYNTQDNSNQNTNSTVSSTDNNSTENTNQDYLDKLLNASTYTSKEGAAIGMTGTLTSTFGPLFATLQANKDNRPFENYYKDYGQQLIDNAMNMYNAVRNSTNVAQNEIARQQYLATLNANQNLANSSVRFAAINATAANANNMTAKTEGSYYNAIANINNTVNQLIGNIDKTRLSGAQQADIWNRKQQDNTWTQLVRDINTIGAGLEHLGKQQNMLDYNKLVVDLMKSMKLD